MGDNKYEQILILYHVEERERLFCDIIRDGIKEHFPNCEVIVEEFYDAICYDIEKFHPDVVFSIMPRDYSSSNYLTIYKLLNSSLIITIITEGFMKLTETKMKTLVGYNHYSQTLVDYYFFWGREMAQRAGYYLLEQKKVTTTNRIKVFGYVAYEVDRIGKYYSGIKTEIDFPLLRKKYKKVIMCVTGFVSSYMTFKEAKIECWYEKFKKKEKELIKKRIASDVNYRNEYLEMLVSCIENNPEYFFLIKLHPVELEVIRRTHSGFYSFLKKYLNIAFIDEPIPISYYFSNIDLLIHYGSTTGLEAYVHKVPTMQIVNNNFDKDFSQYGLVQFESTYMIDTGDKKKLLSVMREEICFKKLAVTDKVLYDFMNYIDKESYHPIDAIIDLLSEMPSPQQIDLKEKSAHKVFYSKQFKLLVLKKIKDGVFLFAKGKKTESKVCFSIVKKLLSIF